MAKRVSRWLGMVTALITAGCSANAAVTRERAAERDAGPDAVEIAQEMVGKPYRFGGSSPKGFDCSGLVHYSFSKAGYAVPRETQSLFDKSRSVDVSELEPGDLLFFRIGGRISHVAIFVEDDKFVHAPSSGKKVRYGNLSDPYWKKHFVKAGRI